MLKVNQIKTKVTVNPESLTHYIAGVLKAPDKDILQYRIIRRSIDARKKPEIFFNYSCYVTVKDEKKVLKHFKGKENIVCAEKPVKYHFPDARNKCKKEKVVVVGMGPAGLFCAYNLVKAGFNVTVLERGQDVDLRKKAVDEFWETGVLNPSSNVQFGEGGAGTFSDGKLNTLVKDKDGRNLYVLETFVKFGAKESICYDAKPHIGTDVLMDVVKAMRNEIIRLGGEIRFESQMTRLITEECENGNGSFRKIAGVEINHKEQIKCDKLVLAIGHSARDTFEVLYEQGLVMEQKAFAVGLRVEHPQTLINKSQYGLEDTDILGAAPYKVTAKAKNQRAVYSFCMCPGGYVVNASSEPGHTAVNGMSYSGRNGKHANSAIIVAVTPQDFGSDHPLAGIAFQRELEKRAYEIGNGSIPVQLYGDFKKNVTGEEWTRQEDVEDIMPECKGTYKWAEVDKILPKACNEAFVDGMEAFGRQIQNFNMPTAILSGIESRTSSPVRIKRNDNLEACIEGVYPCGEGAGYAGGITSAAMDGVRVAEQIVLDAENIT